MVVEKRSPKANCVSGHRAVRAAMASLRLALARKDLGFNHSEDIDKVVAVAEVRKSYLHPPRGKGHGV